MGIIRIWGKTAGRSDNGTNYPWNCDGQNHLHKSMFKKKIALAFEWNNELKYNARYKDAIQLKPKSASNSTYEKKL